jgi:hypothetical protein
MMRACYYDWPFEGRDLMIDITYNTEGAHHVTVHGFTQRIHSSPSAKLSSSMPPHLASPHETLVQFLGFEAG